MPSQDHDFELDANATRASLFGRVRAKAGPEREVAWDEFQARYAPLIAGFAARCGASRQDIDDIIQDVMTGMLRNEQSASLAFLAFEQYVLFDRPAETVAAELGTSVNNVHQAKTRMTKLLKETVQRLREHEDSG